jgi:hypothetical protein
MFGNASEHGRERLGATLRITKRMSKLGTHNERYWRCNGYIFGGLQEICETLLISWSNRFPTMANKMLGLLFIITS